MGWIFAATLAAALAAEAPAPVEPPVDPEVPELQPHDLELARRLAAAHHPIGARALAEAALADDSRRQEAEAVLATLPPVRERRGGVALLAGWHAAVGAWTLGPGIALSTRRWIHPGVEIGGMMLGATLGLGGSLVYTRWVEPTPARTLMLMGIEPLAMWHGAVLSMVADPRGNHVAQGVQLGALVGVVGGGLAAATLDLPPGPLAAASSGAAWGLGLTAAWMAVPGWQGEPRDLLVTMLVGADLGLVVLGGVAWFTDLTVGQVGMMDLGGLLGGALALGGVGLYTSFLAEPWEYPDVAGLTWVTLGAVVGAGVGAAVAGRRARSEATVHWEPPVPVVVPSSEGVRAEVALLRGRF